MRSVAVITLLMSLLFGLSTAASAAVDVDIAAIEVASHSPESGGLAGAPPHHGVHAGWSSGHQDDHESHGHGNEHCGVSCSVGSALPVQHTPHFLFDSEARIPGPVSVLHTQHPSPLLRPPR